MATQSVSITANDIWALIRLLETDVFDRHLDYSSSRQEKIIFQRFNCNSILQIAIIEGFFEIVKYLVSNLLNWKIPSLIHHIYQYRPDEATALMMLGNRLIVKVTPEFYFRGVNLIKISCEHHQYEIAGYLIEKGADINEGNPLQNQLHNIAPRRFRDHQIRVMDLLLSKNARTNYQFEDSILHQLARFHRYRHLRYLIERGFDVNILNQSGNTPLHEACSSKYISSCKEVRKVVILLIENGAKIKIANSRLQTPFSLLIKRLTGKRKKLTIDLINFFVYLNGNLVRDHPEIKKYIYDKYKLMRTLNSSFLLQMKTNTLEMRCLDLISRKMR